MLSWHRVVGCDSEYLKSNSFVNFLQALKKNRLYATRFPLADGLPTLPDITDQDDRRKMWDSTSPIALFYTDKQSPAGIKPLAIQMDYKPGKKSADIVRSKARI